MILLEAAGISKSFLFQGKLCRVLCGIDFRLHQDEFISIVGASGCGKSTLLELLAGISRPDSGEIFYEGQLITSKTGILGYMPQDDLLFDWLKTIDNILLPLRIKGKLDKEQRAKAIELLPTFGLAEYKEHYPWQLSGGLRQRVALSRTYMTGSKVLLLDEPLANLDAITRTGLQDWLKEIVSKLGLSIILVTHDIDEAIKLSQRILVMKEGQFTTEYRVQDGFDAAAIRAELI